MKSPEHSPLRLFSRSRLPLALATLLLVASAGCASSPRHPHAKSEVTTLPLPFPIIDAHVHASEFPGNAHQLSGIPVTEKEFLAELREAGAVGAVSHSSTEQAEHTDLNQAGVIHCRGIEGKFNARNLEKELRDKRYRCIKIYLGYVHQFASDKNYEPAYRLAEKYGVPVVFHTGDTETSAGKLKYADPLTIDEVAVDHPKVKFVIAHLGNPWIESAAEVAYKNPNVYLDGSALVVGDFRKIKSERIEEYLIKPVKWAFGYLDDPSKLLFGTDWPLVRIRDYAEAFRRAIPPEHWKAVFHDNAVRVFHLTPVPTPPSPAGENRGPAGAPSPKARTSTPSALKAQLQDEEDDEDEDAGEDDADETPGSRLGATPGTPAKALPRGGKEASLVSDSEDDSDDEDDEEEDDFAESDSFVQTSGSFSLATDSVSRGVTQTDHQPAIGGEFNFEFPLGFHTGISGANVHYLGSNASIGIDVSAGYRHPTFWGWNAGIDLSYSAYFQSSSRNSPDIYLTLDREGSGSGLFGASSWEFNTAYSPRWAGSGSDSWYFAAAWSTPLIWDFKLGLGIGYSLFPTASNLDYPDYQASLSREWLGLDWKLSGILVKEQVLFDADGGPTAIFSVSKSF